MHIFAAIDVGSYELGMKIFEISHQKGLHQLDYLRHRIELGTDTYNTGKIAPEHMEELIRVLSDYAKVMKSYGVQAYTACATSAIRETQNTVLVLEQIKMRTGLEVTVKSNSEQRFLHYKAVASRGDDFMEFIKSGCLLVDIGGGSIQLSLFDDEALVTTQNIRLGILRMKDILNDFASKPGDRELILDELIDNQLNAFKRTYLNNRDIKRVIVVDDYISAIMERALPTRMTTAEKFLAMTERMSDYSGQEVVRSYGLFEESAELLLPSVAIVRRVIHMSGAQKIWAPGVSLADGIAYDYAQRKNLLRESHDFENDIIACAQDMSKRYNCNKERNALVEKTALQLFDITKKLHCLSKRERFLLRIASILSDCGKYVSLEQSAECGYNIIMATEMIGLSHSEREIVANIVKYNKTSFEYYRELSLHSSITQDEYLVIAKLSALFRIADGVCRSYRVKAKDIRFVLKNDELYVTVDSAESFVLEQEFFKRKAELFREIFAVSAVLKVKKPSVTV